jgi:hypothetical protein
MTKEEIKNGDIKEHEGQNERRKHKNIQIRTMKRIRNYEHDKKVKIERQRKSTRKIKGRRRPKSRSRTTQKVTIRGKNKL